MYKLGNIPYFHLWFFPQSPPLQGWAPGKNVYESILELVTVL